MSKKVDEDYFYDNEDELEEEKEEEDRKCPPQLVPSQNPNEGWVARHTPEGWMSATGFEDDPRFPGMKLDEDNMEAKLIAQEHEVDTIEEAVLFDEKEMIKGGPDGHGHVLESHSTKLWASYDDGNSGHDSFGGQQDYKLGSEAVDIQEQPCPSATEGRQSRPQQVIPHGAFREGGPDIEEGYGEDEFTITNVEENEVQVPVVTREQSTDPLCAELVNTEEEQRHLQEKIDQALQRERQKAVVAEVTPDIDRTRKWFVIGGIFLIVVAVMTTLAVLLSPEPSHCGEDDYFGPGPKCNLYYPNCSAPNPELIGNGVCDFSFNTSECGWEGGDCLPCKVDFFGPNCDLYYPNCSVDFPESMAIGDGLCEGGSYNTTECGWEGGDCLPCKEGYFGPDCNLYLPDCSVPFSKYVGDGSCGGEAYNVVECGWDGGDCCPRGYFGPSCSLYYPNCSAPYPESIGDGYCDDLFYNGGLSNTTECGWDGGDCLPCNDGYFGPSCDLYYPNCSVPFSKLIGDGWCDGELFSTEECGWDGGDCCPPGYFGPSCTLHYPNCYVPYPESIGDGFCEGIYNTMECGWEGGDCLPCSDGYFGLRCEFYYPNCDVPHPEWIGNFMCDGEPYDTEECGWDGNDCRPCGEHGYFGFNCDLYYPNCSALYPESIGDGYCEGIDNTMECGWEGGDCFDCNSTYFGPGCVLHYPNCSVPIPAYIGDGRCDVKPYNTIECGWDGGDCISCDAGYVGPYCSHYYPNCSVPNPKYIGNGICDYEPYNTTECGWDGDDCLPCNDGYFGPFCRTHYPNCSVPIPEYIGDGVCDEWPYDMEECGWDGGDCSY